MRAFLSASNRLASLPRFERAPSGSEDRALGDLFGGVLDRWLELRDRRLEEFLSDSGVLERRFDGLVLYFCTTGGPAEEDRFL